MDGLKKLGSELLGPYGFTFPSLEVLEFKDMKSWKEWSASGGDKAGRFPCLREISITNCPKLDVVEIELIPSLQTLHVEGCSLPVLKSMVNVSSSISRLKICNIKGLTQLHREVLDHLWSVEYLDISKYMELTHMWESEAVACEILVSLHKLVVRQCANFVSLGEDDVHLKISTKYVKQVEIQHCPRLESYICPNNIEMLVIDFCHSITSLTFPTIDDLPSTLKVLGIHACENVEANWFLNNFFSSLESFSVSRIPNLRLFPEGCLVHLTNLTIWGCDEIESIPDNGYGFLPSRCLRSLMISNCKNLKSFPHEHLQSLAFLKEMTIYMCRSLDDSIPCGSWPPNLSTLTIGALKKPISQWGPQNFPTSLVKLYLHGGENSYIHSGENSRVISFANGADISNATPSSLTDLNICDFMELKSLSEGLQHLTCLKKLVITVCPKLRDLPETLLPSLSGLRVIDSSLELRKKCRRRKGKYWPIISQIPDMEID